MKYTYTILAGVLILIGVGAYMATNSLFTTAIEEDVYVVDESDVYTPEESAVAASATLTEAEIDWLVHMREEEKLARDVYTTLGNKWGTQIFFNIAASEQSHTDAVATLLARYGVTDPVVDDAVGVFTLPTIRALYTQLVAQGSKSKLDALVVGATIEDLDIHDLDMALADTMQNDIATVYRNLQKGSRNHLRAFVRQINRAGGAYEPQYISTEAYGAIIEGAQERGRIQ